MSFPDSYIFDLSKIRAADAVRQMGNAVPPNLAYDTARPLLDELMEKFEKDQRNSGCPQIEQRRTPPSEIVTAVSEVHIPENQSPKPKSELRTPSNVNAGCGEGSKDDPITSD
jgi:hypothetical protein